MTSLGTYQAITWSLSGVIMAAFCAFALIYSFLRRRKLRNSLKFNAEEFITARNQANAFRIGWSFFAGALGAWVIATPATYTGSGFGYGAGAIGLVFYSLASGLPVVMIAFAGGLIRRKVPHVLSLTDFMGWRFGWVAKTYVVLLCLFNMSIAILAEYTTIGTLFGVYLGSKAYAITIVVGVLTLLYTTYGGLFVSIMTDQVQGIAVTVLFFFCVIYVAADFRYPLPKPFPSDCCNYNDGACTGTENPLGFCLAGTNKIGYSSIFVMPASLFTATVFSEAMWQRAWASADRRSLVRGSIGGCIGICLVVFFFGLCGILAAWASWQNPDPSGAQNPSPLITENTNTNLYFFAALGALNDAGNIDKWIGVVVILLAVCMNMSAVDSLQNGLASGLSSHLLKGRPVIWTKAAVALINVPWIVLGALGAQPKDSGGIDLKILDLFLLANMICCTSALPVLAGLFDALHPYLGGGSVVFSGIFSIFCTSWYGVDYFNRNFAQIKTENEYLNKWQSKTFANAMNYTWMGNGYAWDFFLIPLCVSLGTIILCGALNWAIQRFRPKPAVPGFTAPATHPDLFPDSVGEIEEKPFEFKKSMSNLRASFGRSLSVTKTFSKSTSTVATEAVAECKAAGSPKAGSSDGEASAAKA